MQLEHGTEKAHQVNQVQIRQNLNFPRTPRTQELQVLGLPTRSNKHYPPFPSTRIISQRKVLV